MGGALKLRLSYASYGLAVGFALGVTGKSFLYLILALVAAAAAFWAWQKLRGEPESTEA